MSWIICHKALNSHVCVNWAICHKALNSHVCHMFVWHESFVTKLTCVCVACLHIYLSHCLGFVCFTFLGTLSYRHDKPGLTAQIIAAVYISLVRNDEYERCDGTSLIYNAWLVISFEEIIVAYPNPEPTIFSMGKVLYVKVVWIHEYFVSCSSR